jgi:preprotein translocase subunit YajC
MPSPTTFFVPFSFSFAAHGFQEPKSASDTPTAPTTGAAPQGAPGTSQPQGPTAPAPGFLDNPLFLGLMVFVAIMLFSSMRKDGKARKAQQAMLAAIKQGDRLVTTSGMHGVVHKLDERTVTLRFDGTTITFDRAAIARVERDGVAAPEAKKA